MKRIGFAVQDWLVSSLAARAGFAATATSVPAFLFSAAPVSLPALSLFAYITLQPFWKSGLRTLTLLFEVLGPFEGERGGQFESFYFVLEQSAGHSFRQQHL